MTSTNPFKSITSFYDKIVTEDIFLDTAFIGCSKDGIIKIESHLNFELPLSIREFLSLCGEKWRGTYVLNSLQTVLLDTNAYELLRETISNSREEQRLKSIIVEDIIIIDFENHLGEYHWSFIYKSDEKENPTVSSIYYSELDESVLSFTAYIEGKLSNAIKYAVKLYLPDYRRFQWAMEYINPNAVLEISVDGYDLIHQIPELFTKLPKLQKVIFNYSPFTEESYIINLPTHENLREVIVVAAIKKLTVSSNGIPNLETLSVKSENDFTFPENLINCNKLEKLTLSYGLTEIPEEVYSIHSLVELVLFNNDITTIDGGIKKLSNLKKINISKNCFTEQDIDKLKQLIPDVTIINLSQKGDK